MSIGPTFSAKALTALDESTSSLRFFAFGIPSSSATSLSVAQTVAPSATYASAIARPMPCPAAVTTATLPFKRPAMPCLPVLRVSRLVGRLDHVREPAARQLLDPFDPEAVPAIPGDVVGEQRVGEQPKGRPALLPRPLQGQGQEPAAMPGALETGIDGDVLDVEVVGARPQDQRRRDGAVRPVDHPCLAGREDLAIVPRQRHRHGSDDRLVAG